MLSYTHLTPDERKILQQYITRKYFPKISRETHLRRRGKRIQTRSANYNTIQPDRIIPEWPEEYACAKESATGKATRCMAVLVKGCL